MRYLKGGLGLHSHIKFNEAVILKLMWCLKNNEESRAILIINSILKNNSPIRYHILSTIWTGIKSNFDTFCNNSSWSVDFGKDIKFWLDSWYGDPLINFTSFVFLVVKDISPNTYVSNFIVDGLWKFLVCWNLWFPFLSCKI